MYVNFRPIETEWLIYTSVNQAIIGLNTCLLPVVRRQAIIWINCGLLLIASLRTNVSEIEIKMRQFLYIRITLLAKKVVTPQDDVSFCDYFYFISPRGQTGCLV